MRYRGQEHILQCASTRLIPDHDLKARGLITVMMVPRQTIQPSIILSYNSIGVFSWLCCKMCWTGNCTIIYYNTTVVESDNRRRSKGAGDVVLTRYASLKIICNTCDSLRCDQCNAARVTWADSKKETPYNSVSRRMRAT